MTSRVTAVNEIFLNTTRFRLVAGTGVTSSLVSVYPPKQILGDYTKDSHQNISVFTWYDHRGGEGLDRMRLDQIDRSAHTGWDIRHQGHLTRPSEITLLTTSGLTAGNPLISQLGSNMVSANGTDVQEFTGSWTSRNTLAAAPTDVKNGNLAGTEYLVFATSTGYEYSSAIATWASSAKNTLNMEFWHDRFWGIDATGQLWYTYTMGSGEVDGARLLLSHNEVVTGLFQARGPDQEFILYAVTSKGLYAHDLGNRRFVQIIGIALPSNTVLEAERPAVVWRERIYLAAGRAIIEYDPVLRTIRNMGFDLDDGIDEDGYVSVLAASSYELFAGTSSVSVNDRHVIMGWDGRGWRKVYHAPLTGIIKTMHVGEGLSSVTGDFLWFSTIFGSPTNVIQRVRLNNSNTRSANIDGWTYGGLINEYRHRFPWFDGGQSDVTKVLLRLKLDVEGNPSALIGPSPLIAFDGAVASRLDGTYTNDSTFDATNQKIEGNGTTTFHFPSVANPTGTAFRSLQVTLQMEEDGAGSNTVAPDVLAVTIEYFKVLDPKWAFDFDLDFSGSYSDNSPQAARALLVAAVESTILVEFTFRDDDGNDRNYYVNVKQVTGMEESGHDETGRVRVRCETV